MSLIKTEQIGGTTGEYALWVYQKGDSTLNKLAFNGSVTTYTDTTHFESTDLTSTTLDGVDDGYFIGWYVYCVRDSGGAGAAPQGEYVPISGYTSSNGAFTHTAFTTPLAVGDSVMVVHPSALNASVIADLDEIKGAGFVSADDSLEAISDEISEILDLVRTGDNVAVTSAETTLYTDDAPTKIIVGTSIKIDTSVILTGDIYDFREYYRIESAGSYIETPNTITISGAQLDPLYIMHLEAYRYGMKITAQKISGTDRSFKIEVIREA